MWQYTALTYSFSYLEPVHCFMSSSNCCFLTSMQISHEAGKVVWYSHLLKNFPQFLMIHTVKGFSVVNETEVDVFLEFSSFFYDPMDCQAPLSLGFQARIMEWGAVSFSRGYWLQTLPNVSYGQNCPWLRMFELPHHCAHLTRLAK